MPCDDDGFLKRTRNAIEDAVMQAGLEKSRLKYIGIVSAKTRYGIEDLVTELLTQWKRQGPIFILGNANCGKSTLFNALLSSDYCKASARDYIKKATICQWPGKRSCH